jgi:light-regulated signal transduction histidine kinase (bacteriophytochrome)
LSLGIKPKKISDKKETHSYFVWLYGKPPDLVVEVVSNKKGGEMPELGLGFTLWEGIFQDLEERWLRFVGREDTLILTGAERADQETLRADQERRAGILEGQPETVRGLLKAGVSTEVIQEATGLELGEIQHLADTVS